jgi:SAM-dependent methyltransferase/superfamily II DNA or RNA helicase
MTKTATDAPLIDVDELDTDAAFTHRGARAAVFRPRFGQAHQQYFAPKWICQAFANIAEALFDVPIIDGERGGYPLRVIDPTCGSGRLLAPFARRGHQVMGIELDDRLVPVARRAVGREHVRQGDVCAYAAATPKGQWDVAVINPPYGLWWPLKGMLADYELASRDSIESQHMVLELVTDLLHQSYDRGGLLLALLSGRFFDVYPKAAQYVKRNYQVVANLLLPKPYEREYAIGVDARLLVAFRVNPHREKVAAPLEGVFKGTDVDELVQRILRAFEGTPGVGRRRRWDQDLVYLPRRNYRRRLPEVPELDMAVEVDTADVPLRLTRKGARPEGDWAGLWAQLYAGTPLEAYNRAEGTNTDPMQAFAALPNVLMAGSEATSTRLASLGFDVQMTDEDAEQIRLAAERYQRERLPVRELAPMEYLAWYEDGPITAEKSVTIPRARRDGTDVGILEGETYDLQVRWERQAKQVGQAEQVGKGSKGYVKRQYIDRGYMVFHFKGEDGTSFMVREVDPDQVGAMTQAFGLPEVETVVDIDPAELKSWRVQLDRLIERMALRNGGLRPYPVQQEDILRMATKRQVALLYEMGGGKSMASAFWASLRGYERVLIVTPASVVPGIIEDLDKWGFKVHPQGLDHAEVSRIKRAKRQGEHPDETTFWVASYESMGLGDGNYDAWEHEVYDENGNLVGVHAGNHRATCSVPGCSVSRKSVVKACPECGARGDDFRSHRGSSRGGPRFCRKCGHVAWSEGVLKPPTEDQEGVVGNHHTPIGPRIKRLFSCVILDEVQDAKSKGTLKGETTRALKATGKAVLSGTWLKGYVTDLFWSAGWLLGFGSPLWPFPYQGGSSRFLEQFGTFEFITKEFAHTLQQGRRKLIPSVSNLGRLWRLLSPFAVRRRKEDFLKDLPPKHRNVHWVGLTREHAKIYRRVEDAMQDTLKRELNKENPSMGVISMALWWGRYASSCPTFEGAAHYAGAYGFGITPSRATRAEIKAVVDQMWLQDAVLPRDAAFNKVDEAMQLIRKIKAKGEKALVFTSLKGLYGVLERAFKREWIGYTGMDGVPSRKRNHVAREFEQGDDTVLLAGTGTLNRGVTINGANHVIILNTEWSPETTLQAEDRCHRPGQQKPVHVHYILSQGTVEEQMWELINAKAAAQRAVFDKEALYKSVEEVMAEAVSAQIEVARRMIEVERDPLPVDTSPELEDSGSGKAPQAEGQLTMFDLFQQHGRQPKRHRRRSTAAAPQQLSLFSTGQAAAG